MISDQTTGLLNKCCNEVPHQPEILGSVANDTAPACATSGVVMFLSVRSVLTEPVTARLLKASESRRTCRDSCRLMAPRPTQTLLAQT